MFTKLKASNKFILYSLLLLIFVFIFTRYNGNSHSDNRQIWQFLENQLQFDIYEQNSLYISTSIFYTIINKLGLRLDNDLIGLIIHYFLSLIALIYLFKCLKKIFPEYSKNYILVLILLISSLDNIVLESTRSSWIYPHNLNSSHAGMALFFIFLWFALNDDKLKLSIFSPIFLATSIKIAWFPIGCTFVYFFLKRKKLKDILWIIPSIFLAVFYYFNFSSSSNAAQKLDLFNRILDRENLEVAVHMQEFFKIILCIIFFIISYFLLKKFKNNKFYNYFATIIFLSLLLFVFGGIYAKFGTLFYPDPKILILNAVRSQFFFQLILSLLYFNYINITFKNSISKYILILIPFLLSFHLKGVLLAMIIIFASFFLINIKVNKDHDDKFLIVPLLVLFLVIGNSFKNRVNKMDFFTFSKINYWSTFSKNRKNVIEKFLALRSCNDFLMFDDLQMQTDMNFISIKSKYFKKGAYNVALDHKLLKEHYRRKKIIDLIRLNKVVDRKSIENENFVYISKNIIQIDFPMLKSDNFYIYYIFNDKEFNKLKSNCEILFNL